MGFLAAHPDVAASTSWGALLMMESLLKLVAAGRELLCGAAPGCLAAGKGPRTSTLRTCDQGPADVLAHGRARSLLPPRSNLGTVAPDLTVNEPIAVAPCTAAANRPHPTGVYTGARSWGGSLRSPPPSFDPRKRPFLLSTCESSPHRSLSENPRLRGAGTNADAPGIRLKAFVNAFADGGSWAPICDADLRPVLAQIGRRLVARMLR